MSIAVLVQDALRKALHRVECIEPFTGPWDKPGTYGRRIQEALPRAAGIAMGIFENTRFPGPPRPIAVQLFRSDREIASLNADVRCRLTYGNGGVTNVADIDWVSGGQFSVVANTLRIEAVSYRVEETFGPYNPGTGQIVLGAIVGLNTVAPVKNPPTFTPPWIQLLGGGAFRVFQLPDFARRVLPQVRAGGALAYASYNLQFVGGSAVLQTYDLSADIVERGLTIPGGANTVILVNSNAGPCPMATVVFELGL